MSRKKKSRYPHEMMPGDEDKIAGLLRNYPELSRDDFDVNYPA